MPDYQKQLNSQGHLDSIEKPSSARIYDHLLGGTHNYAIDREFAKKLLEAAPDMQLAMRSNRAFIGRAVRCAIEAGITQFLDIGSGLPSQGQAHEIADKVNPDAQARVIYVDNEPIAHAHSEILLAQEADPGRHHAIFADFNDPKDLWKKVLATDLFDPAKPTCMLTTALLHFQSSQKQPHDTMAYYRTKLAPGSFLAITHATLTSHDELDEAFTQYRNATDQIEARSREDILKFFGGWPLLSPGEGLDPQLVWLVEWRPDGTEIPWWGDDPSHSGGLAGVAVKPGASA
jgi:O-methyltransferase involved in polyketide biosynthesis